MKTMRLKNVGQIADANQTFGDLTVLVGPQASGKSITLQWLKLRQDIGLIQQQLDTYGLDYAGQAVNQALLGLLKPAPQTVRIAAPARRPVRKHTGA